MLQDIRKSKIWQEAYMAGVKKGELLARKAAVRVFLSKGLSVKEVADLLKMPLKDVRRLAKNASK